MKTTEAKTDTKNSHSSSSFLRTTPPKSDFFRQSSKKDANFFSPKTIQPKLKIGQPGDKYEQEADRVAETVMRMPDPKAQRQPKEEEEEKLQMKPKVQLKMNGNNVTSPTITSQLQSSKGSGQSLPKKTQVELGSKMGTDFSRVNIHADSKATQMNRQLNARAFTHGNDIYFGEGEYSPETSAGKHLLAHELTHVVQQKPNHTNSTIQRQAGEVIGIVGLIVSAGTWAAGQGGNHSLLIDPRLDRIAEPSAEREQYRTNHQFRKHNWKIFDRSWDNWLEPEKDWSVYLRWQYNGAELTDAHLEQSYWMMPFDDTHAKLIMIDNQASNKRVGFRCEFEYDELGVGDLLYQCDGWISADGSGRRTKWRRQDI